MIQVHKEDLTAPPMGPPPSRKLTRTPPVSYQQQQVGVFISETKNRKKWHFDKIKFTSLCKHPFHFERIFTSQSCTYYVTTCFLGGEKELPRRSPSRPAGQCIGKSAKRYAEIYFLVTNLTATHFGQLMIFPVRILSHRW